MTAPANWHKDPYGRFVLRYWDGAKWTEHVVAGDGSQQVDPMGTTTVTPFATPESARGNPSTPTTRPDSGGSGGSARQSFAAPAGGSAAGSTATSGGYDPSPATHATMPNAPAVATSAGSRGDGVWGLLDRMAPDSKRRPSPSISVVLAGIGGLVVAVGIAILVLGDNPSRSKLFLAALLITGAAVAGRMLTTHAEFDSAGVGAGVVGIALLAAALIGDDVSDAAIALLIAAALYLAAWLLPGFFGRTIMLGIGAGLLAFAIGVATAGDSDQLPVSVDLPLVGETTVNGYLMLLFGAALIGLVYLLDRRGYRGTATGLVVAGLFSTLVGVGQLATEFGDYGGPILAIVVGLLVCYVGSQGERRATTWIGAAITAVGVVGLVGALIDPTSTSSNGTAALLAGAVLVGAGIVFRAIRANRAAGVSGESAAAP